MPFAKPRRDELVERLAEYRGAPPEKRLFRRGVEQDHALIAIHGDYGVHRRLYNVANAGLDGLHNATSRLATPHLAVEKEGGQEQRNDHDDHRGVEHLRTIRVRK